MTRYPAPSALLHWDTETRTGLAKDGCCGFRFVAACHVCGDIFTADDLMTKEETVCCIPCILKINGTQAAPPQGQPVR